LGGTLCKIGSPLLSFLLCSLCTPLQAKQKKKEDEQDAGTMVYHRQLDVSIWIDLCRNPQFAWFL